MKPPPGEARLEVLITTLHVLTCLALIAIVLLQQGKGADIGVQLGGGSSQTVFGTRGAGNFLTRLTTGAAIFFMLTSLVLARYAGRAGGELLEAPPPLERSLPGGLPGETFDEGDEFEVIEPPSSGSELPPEPAG